jgi:2,3,4,5-tetrahydropyridine-2-carboxylate N-succinyltransferase
MRPGKTAASLQPGTAPTKAFAEAVAAFSPSSTKARLRVAEKIDGEWVTHQWIKKAVLLSFRLPTTA